MSKEKLNEIKRLLLEQAQQQYGTELSSCVNSIHSSAFRLIKIKRKVFMYFWFNVGRFTHTLRKELNFKDCFNDNDNENSAEHSEDIFDDII